MEKREEEASLTSHSLWSPPFPFIVSLSQSEYLLELGGKGVGVLSFILSTIGQLVHKLIP